MTGRCVDSRFSGTEEGENGARAGRIRTASGTVFSGEPCRRVYFGCLSGNTSEVVIWQTGVAPNDPRSFKGFPARGASSIQGC